MNLVLEKYSDKPITFDREFAYQPQAVHRKPWGMWFTIPGQDDWPSWCRSEDYGVDRLAVRHYVELADDANILHIRNAEEMRAFHYEYSATLRDGWMNGSGDYIDWVKVSGNYDGIIITPYLWEMRDSDECFWYYTWDVASGCVWNMEAIKEVTMSILDPIGELDKLAQWNAYQLDVKIERARNLQFFGTEDPTGGKGRMPITFEQFKAERFPQWVILQQVPVPTSRLEAMKGLVTGILSSAEFQRLVSGDYPFVTIS